MKKLILISLISSVLVGCGGDSGNKDMVDIEIPLIPVIPPQVVDCPEGVECLPDIGVDMEIPLIPIEPSKPVTPPPTTDYCGDDGECLEDNFFGQEDLIDNVVEFAEELHISEDKARMLCNSAPWFTCTVENNVPVIHSLIGFAVYPTKGLVMIPTIGHSIQDDLYDSNATLSYTDVNVSDENGVVIHPVQISQSIESQQLVVKSYFKLDPTFLDVVKTSHLAVYTLDSMLTYSNGFEEKVFYETLINSNGSVILSPESTELFFDVVDYWATQSN